MSTKEQSKNESFRQATQNWKNFLYWWRIEESELNYQTENYKSLSSKKSARKISALLLVFAALVSAIFVFTEFSDRSVIYDSALLVTLAIFVFRGSRIGLGLAMIFWTFSKILALTNPAMAFTQILWWCVYMKYFYLAWKVEGLHRKTLLKSAS